jgi:nitrite reductase (NADH) small subunit
MAFQTVCKVGDIPDGGSKSFTLGGKYVAVFFTQGKYFAIHDQCPHAGSPLSGGHVEDGIVTCNWHAWRFRLSDGAWADNPRIKVGCYAVRIEGEFVQVDVTAPPSPAPA